VHLSDSLAPRFARPAVYSGALRTSDAVGTPQPVEKVGAELKVTTNRAPEASKSPEYGVFGARSGVEAGIEGVFQHADRLGEVRRLAPVQTVQDRHAVAPTYSVL
jgi:hypothetical protein